MRVPDVNKQTAIIFFTKLDLEKSIALYARVLLAALELHQENVNRKKGKKQAFFFESWLWLFVLLYSYTGSALKKGLLEINQQIAAVSCLHDFI